MTREEAIARIKDHMSVHKIYEERTVKITEALNMAISALEQPEIIQCKDCKHYKGFEYTGILACHLVLGSTVRRNLDDFCSRAERMEG